MLFPYGLKWYIWFCELHMSPQKQCTCYLLITCAFIIQVSDNFGSFRVNQSATEPCSSLQTLRAQQKVFGDSSMRQLAAMRVKWTRRKSVLSIFFFFFFFLYLSMSRFPYTTEYFKVSYFQSKVVFKMFQCICSCRIQINFGRSNKLLANEFLFTG